MRDNKNRFVKDLASCMIKMTGELGDELSMVRDKYLELISDANKKAKRKDLKAFRDYAFREIVRISVEHDVNLSPVRIAFKIMHESTVHCDSSILVCSSAGEFPGALLRFKRKPKILENLGHALVITEDNEKGINTVDDILRLLQPSQRQNARFIQMDPSREAWPFNLKHRLPELKHACIFKNKCVIKKAALHIGKAYIPVSEEDSIFDLLEPANLNDDTAVRVPVKYYGLGDNGLTYQNKRPGIDRIPEEQLKRKYGLYCKAGVNSRPLVAWAISGVKEYRFDIETPETSHFVLKLNSVSGNERYNWDVEWKDKEIKHQYDLLVLWEFKIISGIDSCLNTNWLLSMSELEELLEALGNNSDYLNTVLPLSKVQNIFQCEISKARIEEQAIDPLKGMDAVDSEYFLRLPKVIPIRRFREYWPIYHMFSRICTSSPFHYKSYGNGQMKGLLNVQIGNERFDYKDVDWKEYTEIMKQSNPIKHFSQIKGTAEWQNRSVDIKELKKLRKEVIPDGHLSLK